MSLAGVHDDRVRDLSLAPYKTTGGCVTCACGIRDGRLRDLSLAAYATNSIARPITDPGLRDLMTELRSGAGAVRDGRVPGAFLRSVARRLSGPVVVAAAMVAAGCAVVPPGVPGLTGKPSNEFFDELKAELRDVHWRVRSSSAACGTPEPREVDLRNGAITLDLQRIGEVEIDGQLRLVALPLAGVAVAPFGAASASRKWTQDIVLKLDVAGPSRLYDAGESSSSTGAVARSLNAAIDGFMRSSAQEPCMRLSSLKLTFIIDVERAAGGGFKLVVPAAQLGIDATRRDVNTLTLTWDKVLSNALR